MSGPIRGDGVGIEVARSVIRGVRLRHDAAGRLAAAAELPVRLSDDNATVDALIALHAELGSPSEPVRVAAFDLDSMIQRIDVTGRSGPQLNELRSMLDRRHGIDSTVVIDDGPRRWLLAIRWDAAAMRRLEDLAERAGFVDVSVEPGPLSIARVVDSATTYVRRMVSQGNAYHLVVADGVVVSASTTTATGHTHPDVMTAAVDVTLAYFDDFLAETALAEQMARAAERADVAVDAAAQAGAPLRPVIEVPDAQVGDFPEHDIRSARRQAVALGAALGAAGLAGPVRPVDMIVVGTGVDDQFDRPWAIETLPLDDAPAEVDADRSRRWRPWARR